MIDMKHHVTRAGSMLAAIALAGCGDSDDSTVAVGGSGGNATAGTGGSAGSDTGGAFQVPADPGAGAFWVTVSGEDLALLGYDWAAGAEADGDPPAFVDGWAVRFDHVIITVDALRINADPDRDEANPLDLGALVASADGPWAVDVSIGGDVVGKSGSPDERTVPIAAFSAQANGEAFDPRERYAFSYALVPAAENARIVNLDPEGIELYEQARANGWSMILAGTAEYNGPAPEAGSVFAQMPGQIEFTLGLTSASSYINCRNTDLQAVGDEFPRGIQANSNASTTVQITLHTDHVFWDTLNVEGTPLHFDPIAARASTYGMPDSPGVVTTADLVDADVTALTARSGDPLPWRSVVPDYSAPAGQMAYATNGTRFAVANSLASYLAYTASSGGHMNADGECEVRNDYTP
jgi:hypothetical protein